MQHQNNYREVRGGSQKNVAVCQYCQKGSVAYPKKTESLITCKVCKGTYLADPVKGINIMPYDEYQELKKAQMEEEKAEKELQEAEKAEQQELKRQKRKVQMQELEIRERKAEIKKEEIEAKRLQKLQAKDLHLQGRTVPQISKQLKVPERTLYLWFSQ